MYCMTKYVLYANDTIFIAIDKNIVALFNKCFLLYEIYVISFADNKLAY